MKALLLLAALAISPALAAEPEEGSAGWKPLFNGKDLSGWRSFGKQTPPGPGWTVEDGMIRKVAKVRSGDIVTEETFNDFELSWEWKVGPRGNNGIKYFVTEKPGVAPGHEYQMIDDAVVKGARQQTASFYDVLPVTGSKQLYPPGDWNSSRVLVKGNHVEHWLNGAKVLEYELGSDAVKQAVQNSKFKNSPGFGEKATGRIMLTDHGDECWFRNLRIRELK